MRKTYFIIMLCSMLFATACGNGGAFSEEEKKTQDSSDQVRQEDGFEALEQAEEQSGDSTDNADKDKSTEDKKQ